MEKNYPYLFPQLNTIINLNCSDDFIIDKEFNEAIENRNLSYKEYVNALCEAFPVVKSNNDLNLLYEIAYIIEQLYNKWSTQKMSHQLLILEIAKII